MRPDDRIEFILKRGRKQGYPQHIICFDTETQYKELVNNNQQHQFKLGWGIYISFRKKNAKYHKEYWHYINSRKDFAEWVLSKVKPSRPLYIFASNVWFDIRITKIDKYLFRAGYICDRLYNKNLVTILGFRKFSKTIIFVSTQNIVPFSVATIGEWLDKPKMQIDFDNCTKQELSIYCKNDVYIIKDFILRWLEFSQRSKMGSFQCTASSQAFATYRSRFMKDNIYIHSNKDVISLERDAYYGGRTECFYIGKVKAKTIYKLDINSLYPCVMRRNEYPTRLQEIKYNISVNELNEILYTNCVTADVNIDLCEPFIAHKINGRTCFPIGKFRAFVNTEAVLRLIEQNAIRHINMVAIYQHSNIFYQYMRFFGDEKEKYSKQKDVCGVKLCKYFMNCLYGKFGQKQDTLVDEEYVPNDIIEYVLTYNIESGENGRLITYGGIRRLLEDRGENARNAFVSIAAHVTENARLLLWDYIKEARLENVFYCDTDSLFVNKKGYDNLKRLGRIDKHTLGYFRLEEKTSHCIITTCKDYEFGDEHKKKGIRKDAQIIDKDKFKQYQFPSLYGYLRKHPDNYIVQSIIKELSGEYEKGIVTKSGRVIPYTLSQ